jgi:hypothetical protein
MSTVVFEGTGTKIPQSHAQPHTHATSRITRKPPAVDSSLHAYLENDENDEDFVLDFDSESVLGLGDEFVITGGKHPRFWLEDGNVVLVAKQPSQTQFRVHQSVLGKHFLLLFVELLMELCTLEQQDSLAFSRKCFRILAGHGSSGYTAAQSSH